MVIRDLEKQHQAMTKNTSSSPELSAKATTLCILKQGPRKTIRRWFLKLTCMLVLMSLVHTVFRARGSAGLEILRFLFADRKPAPEPGYSAAELLLKPEKTEKLFLSVPKAKSALAASRRYAAHPHLAGSREDFEDAKSVLNLFQTYFAIPTPDSEPIYPAGSSESQAATLNIPSLTSPEAWIDVYYPILNTPQNRSVEVLDSSGEVDWIADLLEDGDEADRDAAKYRDHVPAWHGLSKGGEATGELVYANYGRQEDYAELLALGVNITGKIVITRYGYIFRGLKIKGAQELGAAGVLIFSDPRDDGRVTVENGYKPYPHGPARNPTSVQRGSAQFISLYPGDPSTPGYPAYENSPRAEQGNKPSIPSLPISWRNAERLLEEIASSPSNLNLNGLMSARRVKLVNHVHEKITPIWNTMVVIPGHIKDEVVVIGNHRDAWVMGAADAVSGASAIHEVIRGFGALLRSGWKPLRTILFASWDAEEYGLVGSTEWGEDFPEWISSHVVAYVNVDIAVQGSQWTASASPSLAHLIRRTALDIPHPTKAGRTLWDSRLDSGPYHGLLNSTDEDTTEDEERLGSAIGPLGSGSDFTVFLQRLGIASMDQGFDRTPYDAVYHYHSIYDSERWQEVYADPGFHKHVSVAKHIGLMGLRLIDSIILPLNTTHYALELDAYIDKVEEFANSQSYSRPIDFTFLRNAVKVLQEASRKLDVEKDQVEGKLRKLLEKWRDVEMDDIFKFPVNKSTVGAHDKGHSDVKCPARVELSRWTYIPAWLVSLFGMDNRHTRGSEDTRNVGPQYHTYKQNGKATSSRLLSWSAQGLNFSTSKPTHSSEQIPIKRLIRAFKRVQSINRKLAAFERGFISPEGIKDREWYRHLGVAPGKWLGYGATTFPALTEAFTIDHNRTLAVIEARRLESLIHKLSKVLQP